MTSPQPRRTRRRTAPAGSLPRPAAGDGSALATRTAAPRPTTHHREHHVMDDFRYVRRDLVMVTAVGGICLAFVVGVSFFI